MHISRGEWNKDLDEVMIKLEALHNTEKKYYEEGVRILETLKMRIVCIYSNHLLKKEKC